MSEHEQGVQQEGDVLRAVRQKIIDSVDEGFVSDNNPFDSRSLAEVIADRVLPEVRAVLAAARQQPAASSEASAPLAWLVWYADPDVRPEMFSGEGAEECARKRYEVACQAWTCWLFSSVAEPADVRREWAARGMLPEQSSPANSEAPDAWVIEAYGGRRLFGRMDEMLWEYCDVNDFEEVRGRLRHLPGAKVYALHRHPVAAVSSEALREPVAELVAALNAVRADISEGAEFDAAWERIIMALAIVENHPALAAQSPSAPSREPEDGCGCGKCDYCVELVAPEHPGERDSTRTDGKPHSDHGLPSIAEPSESPAEGLREAAATREQVERKIGRIISEIPMMHCRSMARAIVDSFPVLLTAAPTRAGVPAGETEALADEILAELGRARAKFPGDNVTTLALVEEVGELAKATFEESRHRVRKEAVQVATMAMRVVLDGDQTLDGWRAAKGLDPLLASRAVPTAPAATEVNDV